MEAYCLKCRQKREISQPIAEFTKTGTPITKGVCTVCGSKLSLMGNTSAHAGLEKPIIEKTVTSPKTQVDKKNSRAGVKTVKKTGSNVRITRTKTGSPTTVISDQKLVIVESPAKARTVGRFLGKGYAVRASIGHVRDLKKSTLSVDVEHNFEPEYRVPNEKRQLVKELTELAKNSKQVYLATDPDREGEAIAWHLLEAASIDSNRVERVVFHEITQPAIREAFQNPRSIDMNLVDAQQARRVLDRLVGYKLSPLLWAKVQGHLSAGRVQSVAVRLVVDREREIENFTPKEYWTVSVELQPEKIKGTFFSRLTKVNGQDPELSTESQVQTHLLNLKKASFVIRSIKKGIRRRKPSAPFTTSTLQQEASKRLGFTANRTMALAQQLYEGIDIDHEGSTGLITYMRTDSTNISEIAQKDAREFIQNRFGAAYAPKTPPQYRAKAKGAQEAHEAVRPTDIRRTPESMKEYLGRDQQRLYQLIWQRFLSSQMEDAVYDTMTIDVDADFVNNYLFRSSGSKLQFQGFLAVYEESQDEDVKADEMENTIFPDGLFEGQKQKCIRMIPEQHFTQPPARFTEATLVKALEENGIGRPSTYASILSTIQGRGYVVREAKRLYPTEIGNVVNDLLVRSFPSVVDVGFTSFLEGDLDKVAEGEKNWQSVVGEFYDTFEPALDLAMKDLPKTRPEPEKLGRACPNCGRDLVIRQGRFGKFVSCSGFPSCRYTEPILQSMGISCPDCGKDLIVKRSKTGRTFYGCSAYPECQFTSWKKPVKTKCPNCGGLMVVANKTKIQCIKCHTEAENNEE
ncbi:MAG: type I DNA topoisomerase [Flexilinea sp.]